MHQKQINRVKLNKDKKIKNYEMWLFEKLAGIPNWSQVHTVYVQEMRKK